MLEARFAFRRIFIQRGCQMRLPLYFFPSAKRKFTNGSNVKVREKRTTGLVRLIYALRDDYRR